MRFHTIRVTGLVLIVALTLFFIATSAPAHDQAHIQNQATVGNTTADGSQRFVSIDFNNVDIGVFIKFISELTGI